MKLTLKRTQIEKAFTMGELYVDDHFECYVLEDPVRDGPKVPGATAIPFGTYAVDITFSNRFQKMMPLLVDVPGFAGVRIHSGNTTADTEGCLLVGKSRLPAQLLRSREAFMALFPKLQAAKERGESISIEIVRA